MNLGDLVTVQTSSIIIFHLCDHRCLRTIPDESTRKSHILKINVLNFPLFLDNKSFNIFSSTSLLFSKGRKSIVEWQLLQLMQIINQNMFVNFAPQSFLVHGNMFGLPFYSDTKCLNYTPSSACKAHFKKSSGGSLSEMTLDPHHSCFENRGFHHLVGWFQPISNIWVKMVHSPK